MARALSLQGLIPELAPPFVRTSPVRVPELKNVALTRRALAIIDHPDFQRLRQIRQLGPTHWVYPGAVHTRFEHSIGVYSCVREYLLSLLQDSRFTAMVTEADLLSVLAAGLLHDLGHYPFAHSLEALHHKGEATPRHEELAGKIIRGELGRSTGRNFPIGHLLEKQWALDPQRVIRLISASRESLPTPVDRVLKSILSSTIDADKMDYLERDSIHLGVPYGRNYDRDRLLSSLRMNLQGDSIAVTEKGRVSAEIFVFCRYTMFSEVYWHHTVRSASAMMERALADVNHRSGGAMTELAETLLQFHDDGFVEWLYKTSPEGSRGRLILDGLFGGKRKLYKRLLTLGRSQLEPERREAFERIYGLEAHRTRELEDRLRDLLGAKMARAPLEGEVLIDIPPRDKDALEDVEVIYEGHSSKYNRGLMLSEISRIMRAVGDDFARVVKKIRLFVSPEVAHLLDAHRTEDVESALIEELRKVD